MCNCILFLKNLSCKLFALINKHLMSIKMYTNDYFKLFIFLENSILIHVYIPQMHKEWKFKSKS